MKSESRRSTKRTKLVAERARMGMSLAKVSELIEVDINTLSRWERGITKPHRSNLERLCKLYGATAIELGMEDEPVSDKTGESFIASDSPLPQEDKANAEYIVTSFLAEYPLLSYLKIVLNWPRQNTRYHELQRLIMQETEGYRTVHQDDNSTITRREALRTLALLPIQMCGLSALGAVLTHPVEEILTQCTAGITACWYLSKGKELVLASGIVDTYLPTLKAIARSASTSYQRKSADELLVQCLLLKTNFAWNTDFKYAIGYTQMAEKYATLAENPVLEILAMRAQAAVYCYANKWEQALQTANKAKYLLEKTTTPIPARVRSYVYSGLANYQSYHGQQQDALTSIGKAHETFFALSADKETPIWVDHSVGNLLLNDGLSHANLGLYGEAIDAFSQVESRYDSDVTIPEACRVEVMIEQVTAEIQRDDKSRDMDWSIEQLKQGLLRARDLQSDLKFNKAIVAYSSMRAAWPGEKRIKELQPLTIHW